MSPGDPATCQPGLGLAFLPRLLLEVQRRDCVPGAEALSPPLCRDVGLDLSMLLAAASGFYGAKRRRGTAEGHSGSTEQRGGGFRG